MSHGQAAPPSWPIDPVVAELRARRTTSHQNPGHQGAVIDLPSREALARVVSGLVAALFPTHFGGNHLTDENVDYFVGYTLDAAFRTLFEEIRQELRRAGRDGATAIPPDARAAEIVREFASTLGSVRAQLESDIDAAYRGDPAARSVDEVIACYPGVIAMIHHRLAHPLYTKGAPLVARIVAELAHAATGVDIHPGASIGASFFIDHGTGVVIGETAVIGRNVRLYQAVTLGARSFQADERGVLVKGTPRHPIVEDDVVIYAGATILGRITIGRGSVIGGNVWLTRSVGPGSHVTQALARNELFDEGGGI